MCLAQGHNAVTLERLEHMALRSRVKHSSTEPLRSLRDGSSRVDILSYSGPLGILGCDRKQNTALAGARGRANCCIFY